MPTLTCLCGESIDLSPIPNEQGFKLLWELIVEPLVEQLDRDCNAVRDAGDFQQAAYMSIRERQLPQVYECPSCGRLAVFERASDSAPALWFVPDTSAPRPGRSLRVLVEQH